MYLTPRNIEGKYSSLENMAMVWTAWFDTQWRCEFEFLFTFIIIYAYSSKEAILVARDERYIETILNELAQNWSRIEIVDYLWEFQSTTIYTSCFGVCDKVNGKKVDEFSQSIGISSRTKSIILFWCQILYNDTILQVISIGWSWLYLQPELISH